jgi:hypothetical protein
MYAPATMQPCTASQVKPVRQAHAPLTTAAFKRQQLMPSPTPTLGDQHAQLPEASLNAFSPHVSACQEVRCATTCFVKNIGYIRRWASTGSCREFTCYCGPLTNQFLGRKHALLIPPGSGTYLASRFDGCCPRRTPHGMHRRHSPRWRWRGSS